MMKFVYTLHRWWLGLNEGGYLLFMLYIRVMTEKRKGFDHFYVQTRILRELKNELSEQEQNQIKSGISFIYQNDLSPQELLILIRRGQQLFRQGGQPWG